jgi:hypothetical protein
MSRCKQVRPWGASRILGLLPKACFEFGNVLLLELNHPAQVEHHPLGSWGKWRP